MHDIGNYQLLDSLTSNDNVYSDCEVFEAIDKSAHKQVILKVSRDARSGLREMQIHSVLSHKFIVTLLESFKTETLRNVMIFEKYPRDLQELYTDEPFESHRVQNFMKQLMMGLQYIHEQKIIHRDIKPANIMVADDDTLKIGDFGLACFSEPSVSATPDCVTLWYRPIEILLECKNHTTAIDIWSAGCVMAELYRRRPIFEGEGQISMINKIIKVLGKPTLEEWPTMNELPAMKNIELNGPTSTKFEDAIPNASEKALDIIRNMIKFDPASRFSAELVLQHEYFNGDDTSKKNNYDPDFP